MLVINRGLNLSEFLWELKMIIFSRSEIFKIKVSLVEINCWLEKSGRLADSPKMFPRCFSKVYFRILDCTDSEKYSVDKEKSKTVYNR